MEEEKGPRLKLESIATLLSKPEPKLEWLIENIWVDKARGLIAGNPGVGKTWLALDMLISVTSGQPCLGKYPVRQAATLLVEEEASELNLSRRAHAMARARGLKDSDLTKMFHLTRQFVKIQTTDITEIFHFICDNDIKLVVFDSLRRFHSADENSSTQMQAVLDAFGRLNAMTDASIVLIHHLAKADPKSNKPLFERLRGSSDLWAWRDCIIGVEGEEDAELCTASFQFRDAEAQPPIQIKRCVGEQTGAIALEVVNLEESEEFADKSTQIIDFMRTQYGSVSQNAIFKKIKGNKQDFHRIFKRMEKLNMVVKNGTGYLVPETIRTSENQ